MKYRLLSKITLIVALMVAALYFAAGLYALWRLLLGLERIPLTL